jgi:hypothetical protein
MRKGLGQPICVPGGQFGFHSRKSMRYGRRSEGLTKRSYRAGARGQISSIHWCKATSPFVHYWPGNEHFAHTLPTRPLDRSQTAPQVSRQDGKEAADATDGWVVFDMGKAECDPIIPDFTKPPLPKEVLLPHTDFGETYRLFDSSFSRESGSPPRYPLDRCIPKFGLLRPI